MNDELVRGYRRWRAMEDQGRDEDADAAFGPVFRDGGESRAVSLDFTARAMAAVSAAVERDARRARRTRNVLLPVGAAAAAAFLYVAGGFILSAMAASMSWAVSVLISSVVGIAKSADTGVSLWSVARSLGHAAATFMSRPAVTISIIAIQGIAMMALVALQRLLGSDREFYR